jgi:hypothetical protein
MRDKSASSLLVIIVLIVVLFNLSGCYETSRQTPVFVELTQMPTMVTQQESGYGESSQLCTVGLPDSIQQAHYQDRVLLITWFESPSSDSYEMLILGHSGGFIHWHTIPSWASHAKAVGQLTEDQQEKVRAILKEMTDASAAEPLVGLQIITLSFVWKGKNHILSFSESSCSDELHRLLRVFDVALGRQSEDMNGFQNLCQNEYQGQTQEPVLRDNTPPASVNLPIMLGATHNNPLLYCITWFEQPFIGSYDKLSLFAGNLVRYEQFADNIGYKVVRGRLTDREGQKVHTSLETMASAVSTEQYTGTTIITLSFPWEADHHLLTFGDSNCPDSVCRLFDIAYVAFKRDSPEVDFKNPCQGKQGGRAVRDFCPKHVCLLCRSCN